HKIQDFVPLMTRIDPDHIAAMLEQVSAAQVQASEQASAQSLEKTAKSADSGSAAVAIQSEAAGVASPLAEEPLAEEITFPDFAKVDLRIARIVNAGHVEGADK